MTALARASCVLDAPLRALWGLGVVGGLSDRQLLESLLIGERESAALAFQALMDRHGPMVLRVCTRLLADANDAEDAFQSTFLVLLLQAERIRDRESVAGWLQGVAARVAARARVDAARRHTIERRGARLTGAVKADDERLDLERLIDQELALLPEKYRAPIILCYLEGNTHDEAADQLGWPVGTVRGRLARARDLLRARLARRGVTAPMALGALESRRALGKAVVPRILLDKTLDAAVGLVSGQSLSAVTSARVTVWAASVVRLGAVSRWVVWTGGLGGLSAILVGLALVMAGQSKSQNEKPAAKPTAQPLSRDDRTRNHREMLQLKGTWASAQTSTYSINGVPQPPKHYKPTWSIDRDVISTSNEDGFAEWTYRFKVDPERTPKTIDLTSINAGLLLRGLYKIEGEVLTICFGLERPTSIAAGPNQFLVVFSRENRSPVELRPEYPNAPGCYWTIAPAGGVPSSMASNGLSFMIKKDPQGAMVITLAYLERLADGEPGAEYRPVAFDDKKTRYVPERSRGGGWSETARFRGILLDLNEYRLNPDVLPFDRVARLGVEVVPAETRRAAKEAASDQAFEEARKAGIQLLPRSAVGKPYSFALTAADGSALKSEAFKGKVTLIDCWASWSGACTEKLPGLKALYERRRGDGFEVIGLNFDKGRGPAELVVNSLALPWPQVYVADDDRTRRLWLDGPGFPSYPRVLLIDRDGILRWDGGTQELEHRITKLLDAPPRVTPLGDGAK
jgi:RNA polymerase sigma factor (sigma-70 family)